MRQLTRRENELSASILSDRRPLFEGQTTHVRFIDHEKPKARRYPNATKQMCGATANEYSVEFIAVRSGAGLVWQPIRENIAQEHETTERE